MSSRERFERDGFVAIGSFLSRSEVATCLREVERYVAEVIPGLPAEHVFYENKDDLTTLKQLQRMHEHDAWFGEFFADKPQRLAETLLGTEVVGKNLQYFNKPAAGGQPTPPHQDGFYFKLNPPHALTMWMALEDVDEENGCVRYVKGSHRKGMREHGRSGTLGFSQGMTDFGRQEDLAAEEAMPAAPGDLLAHHALTIHRAEGNLSATRSRRALGFIFYSIEAREDLVAEELYRRELVKQQQGKI